MSHRLVYFAVFLVTLKEVFENASIFPMAIYNRYLFVIAYKTYAFSEKAWQYVPIICTESMFYFLKATIVKVYESVVDELKSISW